MQNPIVFNMSEQAIQQYEKSSFSTKLFSNLKISRALKNCSNIEAHLLGNNSLSKSDNKLNLIISDGCSNIENSYFLYKGYTSDGGISPISRYTLIKGKPTKCLDVINQNIIIIDLYEKSIYLHNYSKDDKFITGYILEEVESKKTKSLVFTNKKIKINIKNINRFDIINEVDDFVNKFIM